MLSVRFPLGVLQRFAQPTISDATIAGGASTGGVTSKHKPLLQYIREIKITSTYAHLHSPDLNRRPAAPDVRSATLDSSLSPQTTKSDGTCTTLVVVDYHECSPVARQYSQQALPATHLGRRRQALAAAAQDIERRSPREAGALGFFPRPLLQTNLPYRRVPGHVFERKAGALRLRLEAPEDIGLPYGRYPRLLLAWVATEAVRTKSPHLELGDSLSAFLRELGVTPSGGPTGPIRRVREQMKRLFSTGITVTWERGREFKVEKLSVVRRSYVWWDTPRPDEPVGQGSFVTLSADFFQELTDVAVPIDLRAVRALESSMALDAYLWLSYRTFPLSEPVRIPWSSLHRQFGSQSARLTEFRRSFRQALRQVLMLYPHFRVRAGGRKQVLVLPSAKAGSAAPNSG